MPGKQGRGSPGLWNSIDGHSTGSWRDSPLATSSESDPEHESCHQVVYLRPKNAGVAAGEGVGLI